jgi:hypothetical protein
MRVLFPSWEFFSPSFDPSRIHRNTILLDELKNESFKAKMEIYCGKIDFSSAHNFWTWYLTLSFASPLAMEFMMCSYAAGENKKKASDIHKNHKIVNLLHFSIHLSAGD